MLSIAKCATILNNSEKKYTKEQVEQIRDFLYLLAEIDYQQYKESLCPKQR